MRDGVVGTCAQVADIGHLYAPKQVHIKWSERLEEEMWLQGDVEKRRNMKVRPALCRVRVRVCARVSVCVCGACVMLQRCMWRKPRRKQTWGRVEHAREAKCASSSGARGRWRRGSCVGKVGGWMGGWPLRSAPTRAGPFTLTRLSQLALSGQAWHAQDLI